MNETKLVDRTDINGEEWVVCSKCGRGHKAKFLNTFTRKLEYARMHNSVCEIKD